MVPSIHTAEGPETINLVFDSPENKGDWEQDLVKAKDNIIKAGDIYGSYTGIYGSYTGIYCSYRDIIK